MRQNPDLSKGITENLTSVQIKLGQVLPGFIVQPLEDAEAKLTAVLGSDKLTPEILIAAEKQH